jgi:hypothetical protein
MIATAVTLAILWFAGTVLGELIRQNRDKILSALQGRSLFLEPEAPLPPVTVRFSPRYTAAEPARTALRAAA